MHEPHAFVAGETFDGERTRRGVAVVVADGHVADVRPADALPAGMPVTDLGPGLLAPGFVDIQVNGGGGVNFHEDPTPEAIARICRAHLAFGVTSTVVTLITAPPAVTTAAIAAAETAAKTAAGTPGLAGLHLEGPHLSVARKGAHTAALIRPMEAADRDEIVAAARRLPLLVTTVAPETVSVDDIRALAAAGVVVSLGHTDATAEAFRAAVDAGARLATHLFQAMSGLHHRAPGAVGTILDDGRVWASLIPDGIHTVPEVVRVALRAKAGPGRLFAISDAMGTVGSDMDSFEIDGRRVVCREGALRLEDGTLAGADIDMATAVRFLAREVGRDAALRMATAWPATAIGRDDAIGRLAPGARADFVVLDDALRVRSVWLAGKRTSGLAAQEKQS